MNNNYIPNLVDLLYESVMDDTTFESAMAHLSTFMGQRRSMLMRWQEGVQGAPSIELTVPANGMGFDTFIPAYTGYYHSIDPGKNKWNNIREGCWLHDDRQRASDIWNKHEFYQDFALTQQGAGGWSIFNIANHDEAKGLPAWTMTYIREADSAAFDTDRLEQFQLQLAPHLRRALLLRDQVAQMRSLSQIGLAALNCCSVPLWLVEGDGKILFGNQAADGYLRGKNPLLGVLSGRLRPVHISNAEGWRELLCVYAKNRNSGKPLPAMTLRDTTGASVIVQCLPLTPWLNAVREWQRPLRMVVLHSQAEKIPTDLLKLLYEFTPAEIQIARHLVRDLTLAEISELNGVQISTTRSQIKSMLHKTSCRRQAELVRLLNGLQWFMT